MECSDNLSEFTPLPSGMRKMEEVPGCGGEANADGSRGGYQPLIVFKMGEEEITCFVKKAVLKVEPIVLSGKVNAGYLGALAHPIPDSPDK